MLCFYFEVVYKILRVPVDIIGEENTKAKNTKNEQANRFEKVVKKMTGKIDLLPLAHILLC